MLKILSVIFLAKRANFLSLRQTLRFLKRISQTIIQNGLKKEGVEYTQELEDIKHKTIKKCGAGN